VEIAEASIRGVTVHEASRILALAQPDEILASDTIASLARDAATFEDRGEHELRGMRGVRRLFAVCSPPFE